MPTENKLERRVLPVEDVELRIEDSGKPKITGYAAKYGKWSQDLGGFTERIKKGAFDEAMENSDIRALKNHDPNLLLGRNTSGTLRLSSNSVGLRFECDIPNTTTGTDTAEEIRNGSLTGCSFSFNVEADDWKYNEDGTVQRTITKIGEMYDVGPVTYPAYPDTTVAARSLEQFRKDKKTEDKSDDESKEIERKRQCEIEKSYRHAGRIINRNK